MPYHVEKRSGSRPWKIIKTNPDGSEEIVGSSTNKADAEGSMRARYRAEEIKKRSKK